MKLNHLNLTVTDAKVTADFLEKYFGMKPHNEVPATSTWGMLQDDAGMVLTLIRKKRDAELRYPETFHIGFIQDTEEGVNEIYRQLKEDGYDVPAPSRLHGSWTFYFQAPGGFTIEVLG